METKTKNETKTEFDRVSEELVVDRENWSGKFDFFFSSLGYAVGLGNVWRFPYLCYRHGGGAFLIPYFICLLVIGIPFVFLEMCVGQFRSSGAMTSWVCVPIFRGIGFATNLVNQYLNIYYNMILAYSLYFLVISFRSKLLWQDCDPSWSSINCVDNYSPEAFTFTKCVDTILNQTIKCSNGKCYNSSILDTNGLTCDSIGSNITSLGWWNPNFPSQDFWKYVSFISSKYELIVYELFIVAIYKRLTI
jgi:hypothetical protein